MHHTALVLGILLPIKLTLRNISCVHAFGFADAITAKPERLFFVCHVADSIRAIMLTLVLYD